MRVYFDSEDRNSALLLNILDYCKKRFGPDGLRDLLVDGFGPDHEELTAHLRNTNHFSYRLENDFFSFLDNYLKNGSKSSGPSFMEEVIAMGRYLEENRRGGLMAKLTPFLIRYIKSMSEFAGWTGNVTMAQANARTHPSSGRKQLAFLYQFHPGLKGRLHAGSHLLFEGYLKGFLSNSPFAGSDGKIAVRYLTRHLNDFVVEVEHELFPREVTDMSNAYSVLSAGDFLSKHVMPERARIGAVYYATW